ncbi:MAG: rhomboid family intramembrane serine protease [Proteobacteria bacterium]|nr:rhomboid family intramembrane serine protease [Pseudomonadota bacterium]
MFIPLHDKNPRILIARPWVTMGVIAACTAIFAVQIWLNLHGQGRLLYGLSLIPATLTGEADLNPQLYLVTPAVTLLTYNFLHGGGLHLAGNMLFLWVFGDNIEDAMGHGRFVVFYLLGGVAAGLLQTLADPASPVPTIGASGAVAAVMGAYLILHPRAKILVPIVIFPVYLPAVFLLLLWIGFQVFTAITGGGGGVAWWAHIGGFAAGALLIVPFRHNSIPLFGGGDPPSGLRLRKGVRRKDPDDDGGP